ncbi:MAG: oligosaccharide flippase family protein [Bryobacteraceae bacterium]|nr:oligosaccharide flippase family protein [Bryobacteraceae bacterium]
MIGELAQIRSWGDAKSAVREVWKADSLRGRFARGAVWSLIGAVISQGSTLAASVVTARLLGREQFGEFGMIQSTVGMLGIFAGLGLGVTSTKYVAEYRNRDPERAGRIIALGSAVAAGSGGLLALGLLAFAPWLAEKTLNAPALAYELRIAAALLFFNAFNGAQSGALSGFEAFREIARINLIRGLATFPVTAGSVFLWGLPGAVWALSATAAATCLLSQLSLRQHCAAQGIRPQFSSAWRERRVLWTFSAPAFLSGALVGPVTWVSTAMLVNQSGGYAEMGVFSAANQWRGAIAFIPGVLSQFALPLLSNLNGEGDVSRYGRTLRWNLILTAVAASGIAVPVMLGAPMIMRLYGANFQQGWLVLVVSAATAVITCVNGVVGTSILSGGSVWTGLGFNAMWAVVLLASSYYLVPTNLAFGLAAAMLLAYMAHTVWQTIYLRRRLGQIM